MASGQVNFGLGKWRLKRIDGSGDVIEVFRTPASLVQSRRDDVDDMELMAALACLYSADSEGQLGDLGLDLKGCKTGEDKALRLLERYAVLFVLLDDDGNEIGDEGTEPDPTSPR